MIAMNSMAFWAHITELRDSLLSGIASEFNCLISASVKLQTCAVVQIFQKVGEMANETESTISEYHFMAASKSMRIDVRNMKYCSVIG